jgi:hypothetical protein
LTAHLGEEERIAVRHQPAWVKPFSHLDLIGVRLDEVYLGAGGRKAVDAEARRRKISLRHITPTDTLFGRPYVFLFGRGDRPNTVVLGAKHPGDPAVEVELEGRSYNYRNLTPLHHLDQLLTQVQGDYPPSTLPGTVCAAVRQAVLVWVGKLARDGVGGTHITATSLREALLAPVRPFLDGARPYRPRDVLTELTAARFLIDRRAPTAECPDVRMVFAAFSTLIAQVSRARVAHEAGPRPFGDAVRVRELDEALAAALNGIRRIVDPLSESLLMALADDRQYGDDELRPMLYRKRDV